MDVGSASPGESVVSEEKAPRSFPNPFNASVTLPTVPGSRTLRIYDAVGRLLRSYEIGSATAVHWDGLDENRRKVASGVYFYRFLPGNSSTGGPGARTVLDGVSGGKLTLVR
jgi:flagellar hook assembly protein FlgD